MRTRLCSVLFLFAASSSPDAAHARDTRFGRDPGFDRPRHTDRKPLAQSAERGRAGQVACFDYLRFAVKEVDLGEVGAAELVLQPPPGPGERRTCARELGPNERRVELPGHYFWGAAGRFVFFRAASAVNGFAEVVIVDADSAKPLFTYRFLHPLRLDRLPGGKVAMRFKTAIDGPCELPSGGQECWDKMRAASGVPSELYPTPPDCPSARGEQGGARPVIVAAPVIVEDLAQGTMTYQPAPLGCRVKE
jgi:hypothetical protein